MIDSLTVSILLFVALAIGAVVVWDAWRAWRLRRLAVRDKVAAPGRRGPVVEPTPVDVRAPAGSGRTEPSFGFGAELTEDTVRPEPQLPGDLDASRADPSAPADVPPWEAAPEMAEPRSIPGRVAEGDARSRDGVAPFEYVDSRPVAPPSDDVPLPVSSTQPSRPERAEVAAHRLAQPEGASPAAAGSAPGTIGASSAAAPASIISERTDCIALLRFLQPVPAERLVSLGQSIRRAGSKPVMLEVLGAQAAVESWHAPRAGEGCVAARFGLLLANRSGPLNALEYTDFAQRIREIAATLGVGVDIAEMNGTVARARALDAEGARLDAQVCVNVDAAETLGPSQLAALSGPLSVVERGNNRYARLGPRGETLFSVALGEQPNRLSFLLDVPRVDPATRPFAAMIECVRITSRRLPGRIIDDGGKALTDRSIETIAREVDERCAALAAAGLPAGSAAALRVFN